MLTNLSSCLLSLPFRANVTKLYATVSDLLDPLVSGVIDDAVSALLNSLTEAVLVMFEPGLLHKLPALLDQMVRPYRNPQPLTLTLTGPARSDGAPLP